MATQGNDEKESRHGKQRPPPLVTQPIQSQGEGVPSSTSGVVPATGPGTASAYADETANATDDEGDGEDEGEEGDEDEEGEYEDETGEGEGTGAAVITGSTGNQLPENFPFPFPFRYDYVPASALGISDNSRTGSNNKAGSANNLTNNNENERKVPVAIIPLGPGFRPPASPSNSSLPYFYGGPESRSGASIGGGQTSVSSYQYDFNALKLDPTFDPEPDCDFDEICHAGGPNLFNIFCMIFCFVGAIVGLASHLHIASNMINQNVVLTGQYEVSQRYYGKVVKIDIWDQFTHFKFYPPNLAYTYDYQDLLAAGGIYNPCKIYSVNLTTPGQLMDKPCYLPLEVADACASVGNAWLVFCAVAFVSSLIALSLFMYRQWFSCCQIYNCWCQQGACWWKNVCNWWWCGISKSAAVNYFLSFLRKAPADLTLRIAAICVYLTFIFETTATIMWSQTCLAKGNEMFDLPMDITPTGYAYLQVCCGFAGASVVAVHIQRWREQVVLVKYKKRHIGTGSRNTQGSSKSNKPNRPSSPSGQQSAGTSVNTGPGSQMTTTTI